MRIGTFRIIAWLWPHATLAAESVTPVLPQWCRIPSRIPVCHDQHKPPWQRRVPVLPGCPPPINVFICSWKKEGLLEPMPIFPDPFPADFLKFHPVNVMLRCCNHTAGAAIVPANSFRASGTSMAMVLPFYPEGDPIQTGFPFHTRNGHHQTRFRLQWAGGCPCHSFRLTVQDWISQRYKGLAHKVSSARFLSGQTSIPV